MPFQNKIRSLFCNRAERGRAHLVSTNLWPNEHLLPPHPSPLPWGEGGAFAALDSAGNAPFFNARPTTLPLPEGEGWGEGEVRIGPSKDGGNDEMGREGHLYKA